MEIIQPILKYLQQSNDTVDTTEASQGMADRFALLRQKLAGRMSTKTSSSRKRRRDQSSTSSSSSSSSSVDTVTSTPVLDLLKHTQPLTQPTIIVTDHTATTTPLFDWTKALQRQRQHVHSFCILVTFTQLTTISFHKHKCFYILVPNTTHVWCIGGLQDHRIRQQCIQIAIQQAVAKKRNGDSFPKIAKDENRLKELLKGNQGRLEHCFKLTPIHIREQLQMDQEAGYSITDEITADQITTNIVNHCCVSIGK